MANDDFDNELDNLIGLNQDEKSDGESDDFVPITRELNTKTIKVQINGETKEISEKEFKKEHGSFGMIRLPIQEFEYLENQKPKQLTHFNLQVSNHKKGETYLMVKILEHGNFDPKNKTETLPTLDLTNPQKYKCVDCIENIQYENLDKNIFENSFSNIQNIEQLKQAIVQRYSKSMSYLTSDEIIELGLSITKLERVEE